MATDTKTRPGKSQEVATHVTAEAEHDDTLVKELSQNAGEQIRKLALERKLSPKSREEVNELAREMEGSVKRLARKATSGEALIDQVKESVEKAKHYIEGVAEAEEKKEKEEEKKHDKKEHKLYHHEGEKPESAKEKNTNPMANKEVNSLSSILEQKNADGQSQTKNAARAKEPAPFQKIQGAKPTIEKKAMPLDQLQKLFTPPPVSAGNVTAHANKQSSGANKIITTSGLKPGKTPQAKISVYRENKIGEAPGGSKSGQKSKTGDKKLTLNQGKVTIPIIVQTVPTQGKSKKGMSSDIKKRATKPITFVKGLFAGRRATMAGGPWYSQETTIDETETTTSGTRTTETETETTQTTQTTETDDGRAYGNPRSDSGGPAGHQGSGGSRSPWNPKKIPSRVSGRPKMPGMPKLPGLGAGNLAKFAMKRGAMALVMNPWFWVVVAIILAILLVLFIIFGMEKDKAAKACVITETMSVVVTGPETATSGQTITKTIEITDTVESKEVTIVATIPPGMSTAAADVASSWAKYTIVGNKITWKATDNSLAGSLNPPKITFTVRLKATAPSTNAVLVVEATPSTTGTLADGQATIQAELSTAELMKIYGGTKEEVEANLVTINFQGKSVRVHKLVKGAFEKVNREITAANTGYNFKSVGTYNWRTKNIPGQNSTELSTHSFGITMDINPATNPYTTANTHDIPPAVANIFKQNGFAWGGDWSPQHDWMHFQYEGQPNAIPESQDGDCAPGAGGPVSSTYAPPSEDTCEGRYRFTSPLGKNFGDPQCSFTKDALLTQLKKEDPANADIWFNKIIPCESGYNANAYAGHAQVGTPDAAGAWGLYQMGSAKPPGSAPPAPGKNGVNDRGDVPWTIQTTNATTYGKKLSNLGRYWWCAR